MDSCTWSDKALTHTHTRWNGNEKHHRATYYTSGCNFFLLFHCLSHNEDAEKTDDETMWAQNPAWTCFLSVKQRKAKWMSDDDDDDEREETIKYMLIAHVYLKHSLSHSSCMCLCVGNSWISFHLCANNWPTPTRCQNNQYAFACNIASCIHHQPSDCVSEPYHV